MLVNRMVLIMKLYYFYHSEYLETQINEDISSYQVTMYAQIKLKIEINQ